jgi:hypothetical protein
MRQLVIDVAEAVYNFAGPLVDESWLSWPWYVISQGSGRVADWLDPIPPRK